MGEGWKPIDLAPRNGTPIVVAYRSPTDGTLFVALSRWRPSGWEALPALGDAPDVRGQTPFAWITPPGG